MRNLYKEQTKGEVADKLYIPPPLRDNNAICIWPRYDM